MRNCCLEQTVGRSWGPFRPRRSEASSAARVVSACPTRRRRTTARIWGSPGDLLERLAWRSLGPSFPGDADAVRRRVSGKGIAQVIAHHERPRVSRRALLAGGASAVVVAGAGGWLLLRPTSARTNTVAVLPFANLSGDPTQNYFSDGMAEEIRSALSALSELEVVARTSSEMLRNVDAITAAKRLSVSKVITGSVRRSPSTVRVSAQLIDGKSGLQRWSQSFDRPFGDVLQIQSDIATKLRARSALS